MKDTKNRLFANMNMNVNTNTKSSSSSNGFTIIEVALVLAIAGLIFLVVFLALPALQNSQKDTARKQDVARIVSALQSYEADHSGQLPTLDNNYRYNDGQDFSAYIGKLSQITSRVYVSPYNATYWNDPSSSVSNVMSGRSCDRSAAGSNDAAVTVTLSNGTVYCASM